MQRRASKNTRGQNAAEKRFTGWVKEQPCIVCGCESGSIVDHIEGSTFKCRDGVLPVLVGMWYLLPLCWKCDKIKTDRSRRAFENEFGQSQGDYWLELIEMYSEPIPEDVHRALVNHIGNNQ